MITGRGRIGPLPGVRSGRPYATCVPTEQKSRRGGTPQGIQPRRLTRQRAPQHSRVALCLVVRRPGSKLLTEQDPKPVQLLLRSPSYLYESIISNGFDFTGPVLSTLWAISALSSTTRTR